MRKLCLLLLIGCGSSHHAGPGDDGGDGGRDGSEVFGDSGPGSPQILSFTTSSDRITQNGSLTLVAIVTDPDGINDLIGGMLVDDSGNTYGAFVSPSQQGTYTLTVTWAQMNAVRAIDFHPPGASRTLVAKFFDAGGNWATASIDIALYCDPTSVAGACTGICTDLTTTDDCGQCGRACTTDQACQNQNCITYALTSCQPTSSLQAGETCNQVCASLGKTCGTFCDPGWGELLAWVNYNDNRCGDTPTPPGGDMTRCDVAIPTSSSIPSVTYQCCCTM